MNIVLTHYLNSNPDPQRKGLIWPTDEARLHPLISSIRDAELVIQHDCFGNKWCRVPPAEMPPNWYKFYLSRDYLNETDCDFVWVVDSTDVEMLRSPFSEMESGVLYVGDEPESLVDSWIFNHYHEPKLRSFLDRNSHLQLLNPGLIGGDRDTVLSFLEVLLTYHREMDNPGNTNTGLCNYVLRDFNFPVFHGRKVNTLFRANEYSEECWWKHK